ncbi:MAG TPA: hypothetical protein DD426_03930, partial [Clostridiaceae bacterium]|nr:hypothetical protein [Clostridiaceae bacterium]
MIDRNGIVISDNIKYPMLTDLSKESYINKILKYKSSGYFVSDINGIKSFISFTAPDYLGWRYLYIVPYGDITREVTMMKKTTVTIGFCILIFGLTISYILSRKIVNKVDNLLLQLKRLTSEKKDSIYKLRQEYVRNIILGEEKDEPANIQERFDTYGVKIDVRNKIKIILFRIDNYREFTKKYNNKDRNLFKFAIMNNINETFSKDFFRIQSVDMY